MTAHESVLTAERNLPTGSGMRERDDVRNAWGDYDHIHPDMRTDAAEAIRSLIDAVVLTPGEGALEAHVVRRDGLTIQADGASLVGGRSLWPNVPRGHPL